MMKGDGLAVLCHLSLRCLKNDSKNMSVEGAFLHLIIKYI